MDFSFMKITSVFLIWLSIIKLYKIIFENQNKITIQCGYKAILPEFSCYKIIYLRIYIDLNNLCKNYISFVVISNYI